MSPRTTIVVDSPPAAERVRTELARAGTQGARVASLGALASRLAGGFSTAATSIDVQAALADVPRGRLRELEGIARLPGFGRAVARTLGDAWRAGIDLRARAGDPEAATRWRDLAELDAHVRARLAPATLALPDLLARAAERVDHAPSVLGDVALDGVAYVPPAYRPLLAALALRVRVAWRAPLADRPGWLTDAVAFHPMERRAPTIALDACADPGHEVVEALRWVRKRLGEGHAPTDLAVTAASVLTHDDAMHARIAESNLPVHAAHGVPALMTRDGQAAAALADAIVRGVSRARVERLVGLLRHDPGPLADVASDWHRALAPDATLTEAQRWHHALATVDPGRWPDGAPFASAILALIDAVAAGPAAAAETGEAFLRGRARALWRRALAEGPAAAVDTTLEGLRVPDRVDPATAVLWAPAWMLAGAPRPRMRLLGLASRTWPRRRSEDPLLPDHLLGGLVLHELSVPRRDRDHFDALLAGAADEVVLSRPRRGGDGRRQAPSPLVRPWVADEAHRRPRDPAAHPLSAADRRAARPSELQADPVIRAARAAWVDWDRAELTPHDGRVRADHPALLRAAQRVHSATSLQRLLRDPFAFMAQYALRWSEPTLEDAPFDLGPLAFGDLLHRVLEASLLALEQGGGFASASRAAVEAAVAASTDAAARRWTIERPVPPPVLWEAQQRAIRELAVTALTHPFPTFDDQRSFVEVPFGRSDDAHAEPPAGLRGPWPTGTPVTVPGTDVEVRGTIDRLDLDRAGGNARVIDYKSGKKRHGDDLDEGGELQRVLYASAVRGLLGADVAVDAVLLHPRTGDAVALADPDAALVQLAAAVRAGLDGLRAGWAVPGGDAFGEYAPFRLALPADRERYLAKKAEHLAAVLAPVADVFAAHEEVDA